MSLTKSALGMLARRYKAVLMKCRLKNLYAFALPGATLASAPITSSAEVWEGGNISLLNPGAELTVNTTHLPAESVSIGSGAVLVLEPGSYLSISQNLDNQGKLNIFGRMDLSNMAQASNTGDILIQTRADAEASANLNQLPSTGVTQVGGADSSAKANLRIRESGPTKLYSYQTSEFDRPVLSALPRSDNDPATSRLQIEDWGTARFQGPLQVFGDSIQLGNLRYGDVHGQVAGLTEDQDVSDTGLGRLRSSNVKLIPGHIQTDAQPGPGHVMHDPSDPDYPGIPTVTLRSGVLQVGAGVDPNNPQLESSSTLTIGENGEGKLSLRGGVLLLGSGGNARGQGTVNGSLNIGNSGVTEIDSAVIAKAGDWVVNGFVTLNKGGYLEVGKPYITSTGEKFQSSLYVKGRLLIQTPYTVDDSVLKADRIIFSDDVAVSITNGAQGDFDKLEVNGEAYVNGGTIISREAILGATARVEVTNGGKAVLENLAMNGGSINFDPPFIGDGVTTNSSLGALTFASRFIDGKITVGRNSMVTLGSADPDWLRTRIGDYQARTGHLWGKDITSALAIRSPQTLSDLGGLRVDGTWVQGGSDAPQKQAIFADKSLLVVDSQGASGSAALSGGDTATLIVEPGAKLLVTDAADGDEIVITDNFASAEVSDNGWATNLASSTDLEQITGELADPATGRFVVRVGKGQDAVETFPMLTGELAAVVASAARIGLDTNSPEAGRRLLSRAVDNRFIGSTDKRLAAATIESAARAAVVGAVPQMAMAANSAGNDAITQRTSLAQPDSSLLAVDQNGVLQSTPEIRAREYALWIMPLFQSTNGFGMEAGNFNYDFSGALGGVALGADYTFDSMLRAGLTFNIGGGYAQGSGDLNKTGNSMNFWGVGLYGGWAMSSFNLAADVSYTSTYNKLKQVLPWQMQMKDLKGDLTAWALSAGLRAEYAINTSIVDVLPHVGVRYTALNVDSYDLHSNGTALEGDSFSQNIWQFPIGVGLSKTFETEGDWSIRPRLDLNITPSAGDFDAKTTVCFTGIDQSAELDTKMRDYITYGGEAGIEIKKGGFSLGVNYKGQFGAESSAHGVFGSLRYEF